VFRSWAHRARASSSTSAAIRPVTVRTRARSTATMARSSQPAAGRRLTVGGELSVSSARASLRTAAASSPHPIAGRRCGPGRRVRRLSRNRDVPVLPSPLRAARRAPASSASRSASATSWCTREGDSPIAAARTRIEIPSARAETSAHVRSRPGPLQPPPGTGDPRQDPPLPPARLDPLADRHPPSLPAAFRKLDAIAAHSRGYGGQLPGGLPVTRLASRCLRYPSRRESRNRSGVPALGRAGTRVR
jgi:hypothetical protein